MEDDFTYNLVWKYLGALKFNFKYFDMIEDRETVRMCFNDNKQWGSIEAYSIT